MNRYMITTPRAWVDPQAVTQAEAAAQRKILADAFFTLGRMGGNHEGGDPQVRLTWLALRKLVQP